MARWTHTRRCRWEARSTDSPRAHQALSDIGRLYQIEDLLRDRPADEVCAARQEQALPILSDVRTWLDEQRSRSR